MNYGIFRIEKRHRGAIIGLQLENNRSFERHFKTGIDFDLSDINWSKTDNNIYLKKTDSWIGEINRQIKESGVKETAQSVLMIDALYTASGEFFEGLSEDEMKQYFNDCLNFHIQRFCFGDESRLLNAVIHLDETTPHMHICSVPIFKDEKGFHLSAKAIVGDKQSAMREIQDEFYEAVSEKWKLGRGEKRSRLERKIHRNKKELLFLDEEKKLAEVKKKLSNYEKIINASEPEIEILEEKDAGRKFGFGQNLPDRVVISKEDFEDLLTTRNAQQRLNNADLLEANEKIKSLEEKIKNLKEKLEKMEKKANENSQFYSLGRDIENLLPSEEKRNLEKRLGVASNLLKFASLWQRAFENFDLTNLTTDKLSILLNKPLKDAGINRLLGLDENKSITLETSLETYLNTCQQNKIEPHPPIVKQLVSLRDEKQKLEAEREAESQKTKENESQKIKEKEQGVKPKRSKGGFVRD